MRTPLDNDPIGYIGWTPRRVQGQEVRVSSSYESPQIIDLGAFEDLTQKDMGHAQDGSEGIGSGGV